LSKLFLSLTWLVSCLPVYFYLSFFWHYLPRPLLVSQQGPDTSHAVQAYQEYFGYPPPSTVQNIYNQTAPDLVLFRFDYTNAEVVKRTANQFHLKPAPRCHLNLANAPQWWQERNLRESGGCFTDRAGSFQTYSLWVDWERRRVFFKAFRP
ncbi:MAG: hypothetical protein GWM98_13840, partial [Nitrospinaceae bacterium]|nr:hypothetical protein [Nitrospinaceae bacterium]